MTASIGSAVLQDDGTIVLKLRAEHPGFVGVGELRYPVDHPKYFEVLEHLGGLEPGETKPVRPWDEKKAS